MNKEIITRKEGREQGLVRYFTGEPCIHGHMDERTTSNGICRSCAKAFRNLPREAEKRKERNKGRRDQVRGIKQKAIEYKGGKCMDCGWIGHMAGFEFDHPNGRENKPGTKAHKKEGMVHIFRGRGWGAIVRALEKVDLVCGTCHNIRTWKRSGYDNQ